MGASSPKAVTELLRAWGQGDLEARDHLVPIVYDDLHRRAARYLRRERSGHTLTPMAVVHETYLRLVQQDVATRTLRRT